MRIAVVSGKGGVGKSFIASLLAWNLSKKYRVCLIDCDVDNPSSIYYFGKVNKKFVKKVKGKLAVKLKKKKIEEKNIEKLKEIINLCPNGAIKLKNSEIIFYEELCEGCGLCSALLPEYFSKPELTCNANLYEVKISENLMIIFGDLYPGSTGSGKVVEEIKNYAYRKSFEIYIIDAPAGLGCTTNAAIKDVNLAIVVIEPTETSIHDAKRVISLLDFFRIPYYVAINKYNINLEMSNKIEREFQNKVLFKIKYLGELQKEISLMENIAKKYSSLVYIGKIEEIIRKLSPKDTF